MGQITHETIKMIRDSHARGEPAPLTRWEIEQLANVWERQADACKMPLFVASADWTERQVKLMRFALWRFAADARSQANHCAQKGPVKHVADFLRDAADAEALMTVLSAAPASGRFVSTVVCDGDHAGPACMSAPAGTGTLANASRACAARP